MAEGLDGSTLEEALRDALVSVLGSAGTGANPRVQFYNKFQREMEEYDRDFEKKYDEDLNTTLIFSGLFSAVTSAFIIDLQSELKPDYEQMNNALLELLLNATTGSSPPGSATSIPRWSRPDPVIVQVQCILYTTLCVTLLASFFAMLGKQWLNRYRQNETRGSTADRSRVRERKLTGIENWKFHVVMELLPLILQGALVLIGFALSRYLWEVNRSVSSVVIGFACFGILFYVLITTVSIFSFDCPFQTPFSLMFHFVVGLALPYWQNLRQAFGPKRRPPKPATPGPRLNSELSMIGADGNEDLEANVIAPAITPATIPSPELVTPLFIQETEAIADKLDARCASRMFVMSTGTDVVTSIMDFIPEIVWHSGIKDVPLKRIYGILIDCFDLTGPRPAMIPKLRDVAYLSARAFVHIALQRRCITRYEENKQDSWKALRLNHTPLSPTECGADSDLKTTLSMVDTTIGSDNEFLWKEAEMTPTHRAWMSHVFLYRAWNEGQSVSEAVMGFVENSMSLEPPGDVVITDCLFIIGLMVGVRFHISDITVRDKSREKKPILEKVFKTLSEVYSSKSSQKSLALHALRLVTRLAVTDVAYASYELFKVIVGSDDLTDEDWEAARHAIRGSFQDNIDDPSFAPYVGEPKEILKFLDYHLGLHGAGEDHGPSIGFALDASIVQSGGRPDPVIVECLRNFNCASPSFVKGLRLVMDPGCTVRIRGDAIRFIALISDQWFNSTVPVMEPEEMTQFCEHLAAYMVDDGPRLLLTRKRFFSILLGMLRSPEWRGHIVTRTWSLLADWTLIEEEHESFQWCLQNAIELLEFTKKLPDGEGFRWWYGTLWFHFEKLDPTVKGEVESIAKDMDMSSGNGTSDLKLYHNLLGQEVEKVRRELDGFTEVDRLSSSGMKLRSRFVNLEGTWHRLGRITGRQ